MALYPNSTYTFGAIIDNLHFLQVSSTSATFDPPFLNGPAGLKYLDNMPYALLSDETLQFNLELFDVPMMIMLGDIFGALYEPYRLPKLLFGGAIFNPQQQSLPAGNALYYTIDAPGFVGSATFGQPNTYVFGKMAFGYDGGGGNVYFSEWKWLNFASGVVFSERPNPIAFVAYPKTGVTINWSYDGGAPIYGAGMQIAGEVNSFYTGNLPALGH